MFRLLQRRSLFSVVALGTFAATTPYLAHRYYADDESQEQVDPIEEEKIRQNIKAKYKFVIPLNCTILMVILDTELPMKKNEIF